MKVGSGAQFFIIAVIDEDRPAAGFHAAINVAPAVADHPALREIDAEFVCGVKQHARRRFAKIARDALPGIVADLDAIDWQRRAHFPVHRLDDLARLCAASDIGLVRGDDEEEACCLQLRARVRDAGQEFKILHARGRVRLAVTDNGTIDDAIAIEEDGAFHRLFLFQKFHLAYHFVLSHFVSFTFSFGWETKRCHTTAWNASECGVMVAGFTVGTMQHASATCAV